MPVSAVGPVETSILQSASDLQILEGHFSSVGRDSSSFTARDVNAVTINHYLDQSPSPDPSDSESRSRSNPAGVSDVHQNEEEISLGQSRSRRSSSEAVAGSASTIQRNCDIYRYHLAAQGRGLPLWIPEPSQSLPIPYQRQGVSMGDVGVVTASGGFTYLFNIFQSKNHPVNPPIMPEGFKPLRFVCAFDSVLSRRDLTDNGYLASPSNIQARRDRGTANFVFESSECNGAILTIPVGGKSEDLACIGRLRKYVAANMTNWYRYACVCRGMEIQNGDLKVVIGCDKTSAWGMACLGSSAHPRSPSSTSSGSGESRRFYLEFGPAESHSRRGGRYEWAYSGEVAEVRAGPGTREVAELRMDNDHTDSGEAGDSEDDLEYHENQCLFLRTMNATLPEEVWQKVASEEEEESNDEDTWNEEEADNDPHDAHARRPFDYPGNPDRRSGISGQGRPNDRGGAHGESRDRSLVPSETVDNAGSSRATSVSRSNIAPDASDMASDLPSRLASLANHPSIAINRFLLCNSSSQTTMAISIDQDWMSAIREDDVILPSSEELLERILESHQVCEKEGVVFLEPKNTDETAVPPAVVEGETEDYDYADNLQELERAMAELEEPNRHSLDFSTDLPEEIEAGETPESTNNLGVTRKLFLYGISNEPLVFHFAGPGDNERETKDELYEEDGENEHNEDKMVLERLVPEQPAALPRVDKVPSKKGKMRKTETSWNKSWPPMPPAPKKKSRKGGSSEETQMSDDGLTPTSPQPITPNLAGDNTSTTGPNDTSTPARHPQSGTVSKKRCAPDDFDVPESKKASLLEVRH